MKEGIEVKRNKESRSKGEKIFIAPSGNKALHYICEKCGAMSVAFGFDGDVKKDKCLFCGNEKEFEFK